MTEQCNKERKRNMKRDDIPTKEMSIFLIKKKNSKNISAVESSTRDQI
jgi:hypothetical protein